MGYYKCKHGFIIGGCPHKGCKHQKIKFYRTRCPKHIWLYFELTLKKPIEQTIKTKNGFMSYSYSKINIDLCAECGLIKGHVGMV